MNIPHLALGEEWKDNNAPDDNNNVPNEVHMDDAAEEDGVSDLLTFECEWIHFFLTTIPMNSLLYD